MFIRRCGAFLTVTAIPLLVAFTSGARGERIIEHYPSGDVKARYGTNSEGQKHGRYIGYHENGRKKRTCSFRHGKLDGAYTEFHENGKIKIRRRYKSGAPHGEATFYDEEGRPVHRLVFAREKVYVYAEPRARQPYEVYPVSREEIRKNVNALKPRKYSGGEYRGKKFSSRPVVKAPYQAGELTPEYLEDALRHLNVYRYLCGLSRDVEIDPQYKHYAQHAAVLCAAKRSIEHRPSKPEDMDTKFYEAGFRGTSQSNLYDGGRNIMTAVDGFMDDSDPSNIADVGHRGWCLDPVLKKTGFGEAEGYVAQWTADKGGKHPERKQLIRYPAAGYFPVEYFGRRYAWSLAFGDQRLFQKRDFEITLWELGRDFKKRRRLKLDYVGVSDGRYGMGSGIVFRPVIPSGKLNGLKVQVSVRWKNAFKERPPIDYLVHFFRLKGKKKRSRS